MNVKSLKINISSLNQKKYNIRKHGIQSKLGKNLFKYTVVLMKRKKSLFFLILITSKIKKTIIIQTNNN